MTSGRVNAALTPLLVLLRDNTEKRPLGLLGDEGVNVLKLNLALDDLDR